MRDGRRLDPRWLALFTFWLFGIQCPLVHAQAPATDGRPALSGGSQWIGIDGRYRPGRWTAIHVDEALGDQALGDQTFQATPTQNSTSSDRPVQNQRVILQTIDGDGNSVDYVQSSRLTTLGSDQPSCAYVVPGSEAAPLSIRRGGATLLRTRFPEFGPPAEDAAAIPEGMPWILVFGRPSGVETIGANELLDRDASLAVTTIDRAALVPDRSIGLAGVDQLMITPSGREVLQRLNARQTQALTDWVLAGGKVFLSLGPDAPEMLSELSWLADWLPEEVAKAGTVRLDPAGLENFTSSQTRLSAMESIQLPRIGRAGTSGQALITGRTTRRVMAVLAARYPIGLGHVTVLAANLETEEFKRWPERLDLIRRIGGEHFSGERPEVGSKIRISGYSDLAGQTRRMLDQFEVKRSFSFAFIAILIIGWIAIVAPLDYLFVRHVAGRPLLGWLTFPVIAVVMSVIFVTAASPRPAESTGQVAASGEENADGLLRSNGIEFLDLDLTRGFGRLFRWDYLYSHPAASIDVAVSSSPQLQSVTSRVDHQLVYPFGYPGQAMGGIQMDSIGAPYRVLLSSQEAAAVTNPLLSRVGSLSLSPRSSKSLSVTMQFRTDLKTQAIGQRKGSELLQGSLTNPLDTDLLDSMLIYRNWVYLLPTRFPAGATIAELDTLRQKNFRWQLSRQRALESASEAESWDVTSTDRPERIAEMMMFHEAVGGANYTSLRHEWLGDLDLSDVLGAERCILVGRTDQPWTRMQVRTSGRPAGRGSTAPSDTVPAIPGWQGSWVRVVLPVATSERY